MSMEPEFLKRVVEGILMAAGKPLTLTQIAEMFDEDLRPAATELRDVLSVIEKDCEGRGFSLTLVASGYRFQVAEDLAPWVRRLWDEKPQRYSRALLETLALIAYRQPITRGDIEDIRGVAVSSQIIKTLLEREWVRVVGHKDVPGRPAMYATTRKFLDYFNLRNLDELPSLAELADLDSINGELALGGDELVSESDAPSEEESSDDAPMPASEASESDPAADAISSGDAQETLEDHTTPFDNQEPR
ncbi:SMC-Scp complex subunit ScpB [Spongiibacter taiwanensis]|uniref:SMC-Scp complex subunit ScpB n=1 Tax=Spongiibacter taiwanensis TaxID=1748242 RepID=UPI002035A37B|nr:SMC-Scp complex subunit ScpB [Spongiibacter taiwanensis]USA43237.1 SMC-Scp complex subunit ScpB [Spongiibacter taiwanensis]